MYNYAVIALLTFLISAVLTLAAIFFFPKLKLMDRPKDYGLKRKPIPYYGGMAIFFTFVICVLFFVGISKEVLGLLIGASMIFVVGFLDDMFRLPPILRLIFQVLAAAILVIFGIGILSIPNPFGGSIDLNVWHFKFSLFGIGFVIPLLGAIFTIVWIVLLTNTMNFLDGVSGLTSGISSIAAITIFILSIRPDLHANLESQIPVAEISLIVAMAAFAFLIFDFPKPKILMGDTGSTFLGFTLATLAIFSGGKIATAFLVLGIPILDALWTIIRRMLEGKKPWQGDLKHLHHRLLELKLRETTVLILLYALSAIFGITAILTTNSMQKLYVIIALAVLMIGLVAALIFTSKKKGTLKKAK